MTSENRPANDDLQPSSLAWFERHSVELFDGEISRGKFELSVALAPLIAFSFGPILLGGTELPWMVYWACIFAIFASVAHYILLQNCFVLRNIRIGIASAPDLRLHFEKQRFLTFASPLLIAIRRIGSWANTLCYCLLGAEIIW